MYVLYSKANLIGMWIFLLQRNVILFCYIVWTFKNSIWKLSEDKGQVAFVLSAKLSHVVMQAGGIAEGHLQNLRFHGEQTYWATYVGLRFACNGPVWEKFQ